MLILSRKLGESIVIDGHVIVKVLRVERDLVKIGIQAPTHVPVHRQEVYDDIQRTNKESLTSDRPELPKLKTMSGPTPHLGGEEAAASKQPTTPQTK